VQSASGKRGASDGRNRFPRSASTSEQHSGGLTIATACHCSLWIARSLVDDSGFIGGLITRFAMWKKCRRNPDVRALIAS
jgi:hypothetical protein